jgi:hypothetical protein
VKNAWKEIEAVKKLIPSINLNDYYTRAEVDEKIMKQTFIVWWGGGTSSFLNLTDTPTTYTWQAGKVVKVNATEDWLEFWVWGGGGVQTVTGTAVDNTDPNNPVINVPQWYAELDGSGKVPSSQLPSYVDDVLEYADLASFPVTWETGKIYIALDTNIIYRRSGSVYAEISSSLALGETSTTAYRGDRGKTAYDHSQTTGNPHGTLASDITDFQTAVSANTDVSANTSARHDAVTLAGTPDYITLAWQVLTRALINLASHVTGRLPFANFETGTARSVVGRAWSGNGDVWNISAWNDTILSRSGSWNVAFNNASTTKTILALDNVDNTSDATKNSATATLTNKTISGSDNTLSNIPQSAVTNLTTDLSGKQETLVSGTNIKTINGESVLWSGDVSIQTGALYKITTPLNTNHYFTPSFGTKSPWLTETGFNLIFYTPFIINQTKTIDKIAVKVTSYDDLGFMPPSWVHIWIYSSDEEKPDTRIYTTDEIVVNSTWIKEKTGISLTLQANTLYFHAVMFKYDPWFSIATAGIVSCNPLPILGHNITNWLNQPLWFYSEPVTSSTTALPTTSWTLSLSNFDTSPLVYFQP